ncbi:hypothetical protein VTN96DRAFT_7693 [Rasamsonia emersonii]
MDPFSGAWQESRRSAEAAESCHVSARLSYAAALDAVAGRSYSAEQPISDERRGSVGRGGDAQSSAILGA